MTSNDFLVCGRLAQIIGHPVAAEEHAVPGQGNVSCGSWLVDRKGDDADIEQNRLGSWVQ